MKRLLISCVLAAVTMGMLAPTALAWGPKGREAIGLAGLQMLRREVTAAYRSEGLSYEADVLRGAREGRGILVEYFPLDSETQAMDAIERQIQVLRSAKKQPVGSYFAYRMGVLAGLTADLMHPYGVIYDDDNESLAEKVNADMDQHLREYKFTPQGFKVQYIRSPRLFFQKSRPFYSDDAYLIRDDYRRANGYQGFLRKGADAYYSRSIEAVVNVWFTVFYDGRESVDREPSPLIMMAYYVEEIGYLLREKRNPEAAQRAYQNFERVNPGQKMPYVRIGDMFYEFGEDLLAEGTDSARLLGREMQERGVHEWKIAQRDAGEARREASLRLSRHFIREGEFFFARAQQPTAQESDLTDALNRFTEALEYDRTNDTAAARISETSMAIQRRQEKYAMEDKFLSTSSEVMSVAERAVVDGRYGDAIRAYNQALVTLGSISTDFKDLYQSADSKTSDVKNSLKEVMEKVQEEARAAMEAGQDAQLQDRFDDAIASFKRVPIILDVIPEDAGAVVSATKSEMIDEASELVQDAQSAKDRYEANQARRPAVQLGNNNDN